MKTIIFLLFSLLIFTGCSKPEPELSVPNFLQSPSAYTNQTFSLRVSIDSQVASNDKASILLVRDLTSNHLIPIVKPTSGMTGVLNMLPEQRYILTLTVTPTSLVLINAKKL
jgi:uncharacterized lipoprotein YajG